MVIVNTEATKHDDRHEEEEKVIPAQKSNDGDFKKEKNGVSCVWRAMSHLLP